MVNLTSDVHPLDLDSLPEKLRQQPQRKNDATCTSANTELKSNENESFSKDQGKITKRTGKRRTKKSRQSNYCQLSLI